MSGNCCQFNFSSCRAYQVQAGVHNVPKIRQLERACCEAYQSKAYRSNGSSPFLEAVPTNLDSRIWLLLQSARSTYVAFFWQYYLKCTYLSSQHYNVYLCNVLFVILDMAALLSWVSSHSMSTQWVQGSLCWFSVFVCECLLAIAGRIYRCIRKWTLALDSVCDISPTALCLFWIGSSLSTRMRGMHSQRDICSISLYFSFILYLWFITYLHSHCGR